MALVDDEQPDLVVAETRTRSEGMTATTFIRLARGRVPFLRVIVLGESADPSDIDAAFEAGALAYVIKTAAPADVAATIRQTFDHSIFLAPVGPAGPVALRPVAVTQVEEDDGPATLTRREREILRLVAEGHSNRELAKRLWVTEQTVKFHLSNIYRKLDVANRTEASRWAHRHGLVDDGLGTEVRAAAG